MKKQRKTKEEIQKCKMMKSVSVKRAETSLPVNLNSTATPNSLLIQNAVNGPPGRSRSPGLGTAQSGTRSNKFYFF